MFIKRFLVFKYSIFNFFLLTLLSLLGPDSFSQIQQGILKGRVIDGTTHRILAGVVVSSEDSAMQSLTAADGYYLLNLKKGVHTVYYRFSNFQSKVISQVKIENSESIYLNVILYPIAQAEHPDGYKKNSTDSISPKDSLLQNTFYKEHLHVDYNPLLLINGLAGDIIPAESIRPGTDKNASLLLKRLNGVVLIDDNPSHPFLHSFLISGMGERYNQLSYNGSLLGSFNALSNAYLLESLPAEAIEEVSVQKAADGIIPSTFAGGNIAIKTKDYTDKDFYYMQVGTGFNSGNNNKDFYGDKRNEFEFIGLSGDQRNLPGQFPSIKSIIPISDYNVQEKTYLSKQLKNNLAPVNYGTPLNEKILFGVGKNFKLKAGPQLSFIAFLNQSTSQRIETSIVQVAPNTADNHYPFSAADKPVLFSQSYDSNYHYNAQLNAIINASLRYGNNKISFRNFLSSQLDNNYTRRYGVYKPDEDTLAHDGINYTTTQRYFINTQLAGEHVLGSKSKLKLDWQATYTFYKQQNPDERNFLLLTDATMPGKYELATPLTNLSNLPNRDPSNFPIYNPIADAIFTNSGRLWRSYTDHNFTGSFNLSLPFNLFKQVTVLNGGVYIQENYRVLFSNKLLYQGKGFFALNDLIAPERYYPGGLTADNFFTNDDINFNYQTKRDLGNYQASANTGAAYVATDYNILNKVKLHLGIRLQTNSQLASNSRYITAPGYRYTRSKTINKNTRVTSFEYLPSVAVEFNPYKKIILSAAYFKTVNRPQLQELIPYSNYDFNLFMVKTGNIYLATTDINNYRAGISFLADAFSSISLAGFYKKIDQPIEYILSAYGKGNILSTPHNTPPAKVSGLEASIKLSFRSFDLPALSSISIFANGNITNSKVEAGPIRSYTTPLVSQHSLSGSPDYSFNSGLVIQHQHLPELTILFSQSGDYIVAVSSGIAYSLSNGNTIQAIPDYRVKGRQQLDIQLAQKILKNGFQLIAGVNNLLSSPYIQYQDLNGNKKFDSPLVLVNNNGNGGGYYVSGTDNTISNTKQLPTYYFTVSYLFK